MKKRTLVATFCAGVWIFMAPAVSLADNCMACHQKHSVTVKIPVPAPIKISANGKTEVIELDRAFRFHGHECPGMTIAYRGVQYGLELLFPNEIPRREDLLLTCEIASAGVKDLLDLVMKGDNPTNKTWPPAGMGKGRDRFVFTFLRKSTCQAVEIKLNEELFPADFFPLKKKKGENRITKEEDARLHGLIKKILLEFPVKPAEELFGKPQPRKIIVWGTLAPGELDKHIRKLRQEEKKKALQGVTKEK